ncbi:hypothetical protein T265_04781 [Opisthorchis viverrini]|uniref:Uncharacterized protein n=1 Tax=Opisthorchis viverrini TaxID=6198 RepID=A0A074ZRE7_OPIVI|nr:hypothetical protein T265_04781 [Opisthorchis viverrini]KER28402.1 hypothetical protein T265_04781 [Opisthorchis viverrini]
MMWIPQLKKENGALWKCKRVRGLCYQRQKPEPPRTWHLGVEWVPQLNDYYCYKISDNAQSHEYEGSSLAVGLGCHTQLRHRDQRHAQTRA